VVPPDFLTGPLKGRDGTEPEFRSYIARGASLGRRFGLVLVDGRARVAAGRAVLSAGLLEGGGVLVLHDWQRKEYRWEALTVPGRAGGQAAAEGRLVGGVEGGHCQQAAHSIPQAAVSFKNSISGESWFV
jgi:hypothetical protein